MPRWVFMQKKRGRGEHGKNKSAEERALLEEVRFLKQLKRDDPVVYQEIMRERVRSRFGLGKRDERSELERAAETFEQIERIKAFRGERSTDGELGMIDRLADSEFGRGLGDALGRTAGAALAALAAPKPEPQPGPSATVQPVAQVPQQLSAPPSGNGSSQEEASMIQLTRDLEGKTPADAAAYLLDLAKRQPKAAELVAEFIKRPDDNLPVFLNALVAQYPVVLPLADWLRQRWPWFLETVAEMRQRSDQQPTRSLNI